VGRRKEIGAVRDARQYRRLAGAEQSRGAGRIGVSRSRLIGSLLWHPRRLAYRYLLEDRQTAALTLGK